MGCLSPQEETHSKSKQGGDQKSGKAELENKSGPLTQTDGSRRDHSKLEPDEAQAPKASDCEASQESDKDMMLFQTDSHKAVDVLSKQNTTVAFVEKMHSKESQDAEEAKKELEIKKPKLEEPKLYLRKHYGNVEK